MAWGGYNHPSWEFKEEAKDSIRVSCPVPIHIVCVQPLAQN